MESKEILGMMSAYSSIYEKKEEPEMEEGEEKESEKDEGGKHKEGKHKKGKEEKGEKVTEKEDEEDEKEMKESADLFDAILEHLVAEGYADTNKAALAIMANMSEKWRQSINEGMGLSVGGAKLIGKLAANSRTPEAQATKAAQKNITDPIGFAIKGATKAVLGVGDKKNAEMMQKRRPN
jgi:hypothetical protein